MAALLIDAVEVKAAELRRLPDEKGGGGLRRTVNGDLRGRADWTKLAWAGTLYAEDAAELAAILAAADGETDRTVTGDAIPGTVTAKVSVTGDTPYVRSGATWYFMVPISVRQT